jgi:dephospho-CoA kinase
MTDQAPWCWVGVTSQDADQTSSEVSLFRHSNFVLRHFITLPVTIARVFKDRPIIGIAGGIGSGKSFVARLFGELGCCVIQADEQVRLAYEDPEIRAILRQWWGSAIFSADGSVNRSEIARRVFSDSIERSGERARLEQLLHPWIARQRDLLMEQASKDAGVLAFVWDTPLLFETGLDRQCDAVVYVQAPQDLRIRRVSQARGWDAMEIIRREKLQLPLDKKQSMSHYTIANTADAAASSSQVREILSRILAK